MTAFWLKMLIKALSGVNWKTVLLIIEEAVNIDVAEKEPGVPLSGSEKNDHIVTVFEKYSDKARWILDVLSKLVYAYARLARLIQRPEDQGLGDKQFALTLPGQGK